LSIYGTSDLMRVLLYCKRRIDYALTELFLPAAQYEKLCYFEKLLMAQQEKARFQFAAHRASLKAQLPHVHYNFHFSGFLWAKL